MFEERIDKLACEVVQLTTSVAVLNEAVGTLKDIADRLTESELDAGTKARACRAEVDKSIRDLAEAQSKVEGARSEAWKFPAAIAAVISSAIALVYFIASFVS